VHESFLKVPVEREDAALAWWRHYLRGHAPKIESITNPGSVHVLDLFCGSGGLALGLCEGLRACGFDPRVELAVDVDKQALDVYAYNLKPTRTLQTSVTNLVDFQIFGQVDSAEFAYAPTIIDERVSELKDQIEVLCAGPPCQGHSNLNNHSRRDDPRNLLYLSVPAVAISLNVPVVIIENVPEVTSDKFGVVRTAIALLKRSGYQVTDHVIKSSSLGCAQVRRRYFLIASRGVVPQHLNSTVAKIKKDTVSIAWAIDDLLNTVSNSVFDCSPSLSVENQKRVDYLFDEDLFDLPNQERPDCHKNGHTYGSVYGRLDWNKPAQTITTGFLTPGRGRFIHPLKRRVLTPHEAARLQAFPDSFKFLLPGKGAPSRLDLSKWIGDAVPSVMGYAAGLCISTALGTKSSN
jgi:DNA (cytosine-5)-methyltransferase 1